MMIQLAKYKKFLLDKDIYIQNKKFWNDTVSSLSESDFEEWVITTFANGEDFFDGNPIFSALYSRLNKAIRIIQIPIDKGIASLRVWLDNVNYDDKSINELVIVVQLNDKTYNSTISLITLFLSNQEIGKYIHAYNTFYKKEINFKSIGLDLDKVKSKVIIKPFHELNHLNLNQLKAKKLDINSLREIYKKIATQKRSLEIERTPNSNKLKKIDKDVRKEIDVIISILTIGHLVDFKNDINKDIYIDLIEKKYGIDNYVYKLHKTSSHIDALNKETINNLIP